MAQYRVLAKSFINDTIVEEGEIVNYDGKPGANLELVVKAEAAPAPKKGKGKESAAAPVDAEQGE